MLRTILAAIVAWLAWGVLDQLVQFGAAAASPDSFDDSGLPTSSAVLAAFLVLRTLYSVVAGWIAARIAPPGTRAGLYAATVLLLLTGIGVQVGFWEQIPLWYHVPFLLLIAPAALLGGRLGRRAE